MLPLLRQSWTTAEAEVTAPNLLSLLRILLVPLTIWLIISDQLQLAFLTLVVAGLTDAADGYLAKRFGMQTELGAYLDPLADKLLLVSTFVTLGLRGDVPSWFVILIVSRDIMIVAAILLSAMLARPVRMRPLIVSKINTAAQIILALTTLADRGFDLGLAGPQVWMVYVTAMLTIASAAAYMVAWLQHMTGSTNATGEREKA